MIKFSIFTLVFTVIYWVALEMILVFTLTGTMNDNFLWEVLVRVISVWLAIATASFICFKGKINSGRSATKDSLSLAGIYLALDVLLLFVPNPPGIHVGAWIILGLLTFLNIPVAFLVSRHYFKKYSL